MTVRKHDISELVDFVEQPNGSVQIEARRVYETDQIENAIAMALRDGNLNAAASLLGLLARVAPDRADVVRQAINLLAGFGG